MAPKALAAIAAIAAATLLAATTAPVATAAPPQPADYAVASFSFETGFGVAAIFTSVDGALCLPPPSESCFSGVPLLLFPGLTTTGMTVWNDPSSPNFTSITSALTNGHSDLLSWMVEAPGGAGGASLVGVPEQTLLDGQVGPSGVDLAGYRIDRIGLHVDAISFASPGTDPNGDGIWTDFSIRGTFIFEGTIASANACKGGGWQMVRGPGGTTFKNQGQCVRFVRSGR